MTGSRSGGSPATETTAQTPMIASTNASSARAACTIRSDASSRYSTAEAAAKAPANTKPIGVASTNPALPPSTTTFGVASACRPRKPALTRNARPISSSRASRRRRPASLIAIASAPLATPAPSTIQKWTGSTSQRTSSFGAEPQDDHQHERQREAVPHSGRRASRAGHVSSTASGAGALGSAASTAGDAGCGSSWGTRAFATLVPADRRGRPEAPHPREANSGA